MEATMEKLDLMNLDKSGWQPFRFEEIARKVTEPVDPSTTTLEKYVGLEHLDAEDIHIRRFGTPDQVSGGKLKCYPGDVIFGKRRAYQRKAAIVDFEGICSAHAFVFRANPKVIDPRLFPFFLHSDQFMHRAVDISVGGLSPTINWGDLKGQEFFLPPKAEQARLAELLWAMDSENEKLRVLWSTQNMLIKRILKDLFSKSWNSNNPFLGKYDLKEFRSTKLSQACSESMFGPRFSSNLYAAHGNVACLRTSDIDENGEINLETMPRALIPKNKFKEHYLSKGDLVISRSGTCGLTGVFQTHTLPVLPAAFLIRFRLNPNYDPFYIKLFFNSEAGKLLTTNLATGAVQKNLTSKALLEVEIPIPSLDTQNEILTVVKSLNKTKVEDKIASSTCLQKSLINQIFGYGL